MYLVGGGLLDVAKIYCISFNRIGGTGEMMRLGLYMNDLSLHDMSREMVLSGIKPMHQLEKTLEKVSELSLTSTFNGTARWLFKTYFLFQL